MRLHLKHLSFALAKVQRLKGILCSICSEYEKKILEKVVLKCSIINYLLCDFGEDINLVKKELLLLFLRKQKIKIIIKVFMH